MSLATPFRDYWPHSIGQGIVWNSSPLITAPWVPRAKLFKGRTAKDASVVEHRVERNEGYGNGVLSALPVCSAPWVGMIPADGQVDAEDVARLFDAMVACGGNALAKVRRRFRMDGLWRKIVSI